MGIPGRDAVAGAVFVIYGESGGLGTGGQLLQQSNPDIEGDGEPDDRFGWALAARDWNGDGRDDLAVGVPLENGYGAVQLFFGGESALDLVQDILWTQNSIAGTSEPGDFFGSALTTGDFDGDGYGDLVDRLVRRGLRDHRRDHRCRNGRRRVRRPGRLRPLAHRRLGPGRLHRSRCLRIERHVRLLDGDG